MISISIIKTPSSQALQSKYILSQKKWRDNRQRKSLSLNNAGGKEQNIFSIIAINLDYYLKIVYNN